MDGQFAIASFQYCPIPGVAYKRLEREMFCHNYYLNNLCDEVRFPDWPIAEPVEVFRACLETFKNQLNRDEEAEEEALESAIKVLNLKRGDGSKELRKAYRSLARKYHPDKVCLATVGVVVLGFGTNHPFSFRTPRDEKHLSPFSRHMSYSYLWLKVVKL